MAQIDRLIELLAPVVMDLGYEFVGMELNPHPANGFVRIYIDAEDGITLEDCEKVSREVSAQLDVDDVIKGRYNLEISSPGMDRPLFTAEQFSRFIGETVKVTLARPVEGRRKLKGTIVNVENATISVDVDGQQFAFDNADVVKARLVPQFGE